MNYFFESAYLEYQKTIETESRENHVPFYSKESYHKTFFPARNIDEFIILCSSDVDFFERWIQENSHIRKFSPKQDESIAQKKIILELISFLVFNSEIWDLKTNGQIYYILNNAIASWSGYNHLFFTSNSAQQILEDELGNCEVYSRSSIFNIRDENSKKILTFEHVVPVSIQREFIRQEIKNGHLKNINDLNTVLSTFGAITIITQEENKKLRDLKLNTSMGENIELTHDSLWQRYRTAEIQVSDELIPVRGKMYR
jgi:hypothetical protein